MTIFYSPNVLNSFEINHLVLLVLPPFENWIVQGNAESTMFTFNQFHSDSKSQFYFTILNITNNKKHMPQNRFGRSTIKIQIIKKVQKVRMNSKQYFWFELH